MHGPAFHFVFLQGKITLSPNSRTETDRLRHHAANKGCFQGHPSTETGIFRWASFTGKTVPKTWRSECFFCSEHCQPHAGSGDPASYVSSSSCCLFCHCCFSPLVWIPLLFLVPCECVCEHDVEFSQRSLPGGSLQLEDLNSSFSAVLFRKTPLCSQLLAAYGLWSKKAREMQQTGNYSGPWEHGFAQQQTPLPCHFYKWLLKLCYALGSRINV